MRFPESFLTELKSRVPLSSVIGRKVRLKRQGKDLVGLSPFSSEKTPSFHVHDDRGFYKCFSTQKGGDVFNFLMETERLSFGEAVEKLAREAGMELPRQSAEEQQTWRKRTTLIEWTEMACRFYEDQLRGPGGAEARDYLERRGFGRETWTRHRMGYAPGGWRTLSDHLTKQGAPLEELIAAGLLVEPEEKGKVPWDRFRNRVIFPISDPSGKVIAFGARTLEPDGKPKYLNSSDSDLFHKGRTLYRLGPAREALAQLAQDKDPQVSDSPLARGLVVTEGYVDAIALAEVGIGTGVAPLGTALTEEQLDLLWRAGPEPILCFDGDAAGQRAAYRALDRALPMIAPGRTLYFALMPAGMDPDDVIRARGAETMRGLLQQARPLVDLLWMREIDASPTDTPERRAGLEARLMEAVGRIGNQGVKKAYERELRDRLFQHFRPQRQPFGSHAGFKGGTGRTVGFAGLKKGDSPGPTGERGLRLIVKAIETPQILEQAREAASRAVFEDPDVAAIRDAAFYVLDNTESLDRAAVAAHLRSLGRKRAVELLETMPAQPPMDPRSGEGRAWLTALEQFPVSAAIVGEARSTILGEDGTEVMSAAHEARIRALVMDRRRIARPGMDEAATGTTGGGTHELRAALGMMGAAVERQRPED